MKKLILLAAVFSTFGLTNSNAQEFRLGIHAGVPVGDVSDFHNFDIGGEVTYLLNPLGLFQFGPMVGYSHYFGESGEEMGMSFEVGDIQFLPIAASGRVALGDAVFAGLDLGYGLGLNDGNDGAFFYRPKLGFDLLGVGIVGSFENFSRDGGTVSSVNVGVEFGF